MKKEKKEYLASLAGCSIDDIAFYEIQEIKSYTVNKVIYKEGL